MIIGAQCPSTFFWIWIGCLKLRLRLKPLQTFTCSCFSTNIGEDWTTTTSGHKNLSLPPSVCTRPPCNRGYLILIVFTNHVDSHIVKLLVETQSMVNGEITLVIISNGYDQRQLLLWLTMQKGDNSDYYLNIMVQGG